MKAVDSILMDDFTGASLIENFRVTKDKLLVKRSGSHGVYNFPKKLRGALSVADTDGEFVYVVSGTTLYKLTQTDGVYSAAALGSLPGVAYSHEDEQIELFMFTGKLYLIGGGSYCRYDGNAIQAVEGYIPLITRYAGANGIGNDYERKNLLTQKARIRFSPDGTSRNFRIATKVRSIDAVFINGYRTTDYTTEINAYHGLVKFDALYSKDANDLIEVYYTADGDSTRERVTSCRHAAVYGGDTDSRVFLYGGTDSAVIYPSEPIDAASKSTLSGDYFPMGGEIVVGDGNLSVTGAVRQFDRLAIFTGDGAFYTYPYDAGLVGGIRRYTFPILPLNSEVGATKKGGAVLVENEPYALSPYGLYRFKSTSVRDERLAVLIEAPVFAGLTRDFIEACGLYVNRLRGELWCYHDGHAIIYNARLGCWYRFTGFDADFMLTVEGEAAYCKGSLFCLFKNGIYADNGTPFSARFESTDLALNNEFSHKTLYRFGLSVEREAGAQVICRLESDKGDALHYTFMVTDTDEGAPVVFKTRARLGKVEHLALTVESPPDHLPLTVRSAMLNFR